MTAAATSDPAAAAAAHQPGQQEGCLVGIGAAAAAAGVSERALRYYQQLGLITPSGCTPGGMRRYSPEDLQRVARIRQLQTLLGLNLDEIAVVLQTEDRISQIRRTYHDEGTSAAERRDLAAESLALQQDLRLTVEAKRLAIDAFMADLDARIGRTTEVLAQMTAGSGAGRSPLPPGAAGTGKRAR